jgi:hypothetical protein
MKKLLVALIALLIISAELSAQELQCGVTVVTPQLQVVDPKVFQTFEDGVFEFMNTRKWTNDKFKQEERIACEINITITEEISNDRFRAQVSIQSRRPVFNSDYETVLFNWVDKDWEFTYREYQPFEFNENTFTNNLTSMLAYYAYVIIGLDYDSFESNGGTPYLLLAQKIVNNASNAPETGWKPYDGIRNRYWLTENLMNPKFAAYRQVYYKYHFEGLDKFHEDQLGPIAVINQCLDDLNRVNSSNPNSMAIQLFFNAKSDELVGIFTSAPPRDKTKAVGILNRIDPTNANKYRGILTGGK